MTSSMCIKRAHSQKILLICGGLPRKQLSVPPESPVSQIGKPLLHRRHRINVGWCNLEEQHTSAKKAARRATAATNDRWQCRALPIAQEMFDFATTERNFECPSCICNLGQTYIVAGSQQG